MACFALNALAQPYGRLCGLSYNNSALLGTSPIICCFDSVNILITWIASVMFSNQSWKHAATRILRERITKTLSVMQRPDDLSHLGETRRPVVRRVDTEAVNRLRAMKHQKKERYILFGLSVVPQFLKLFGSTGMPLMQALGAMYLVSWVVLEALLLAAELDNIDKTRPSWVTPVQIPFKHWYIREWWGGLGLVTHSIVYVCFLLLPRPLTLIKCVRLRNSGLLETAGFSIPYVNFLVVALISVGLWIDAWSERESQSERVDDVVREDDILWASDTMMSHHGSMSTSTFVRTIHRLISSGLIWLAVAITASMQALLDTRYLDPDTCESRNSEGGNAWIVGFLSSFLGMTICCVIIISSRWVPRNWARHLSSLAKFTCSLLPFLLYTYVNGYDASRTTKLSWDEKLG
jgi:hypothetical protein